jgi:hypothetical protein
MGQLTSLDTQFLAAEDERTHLNVSALSILDPSTTADGKRTLDELTSVVASRLHLLPPALAARRGTAEARLPVLVDIPTSISSFTSASRGYPSPATSDNSPEQVSRIVSRPPTRPGRWSAI